MEDVKELENAVYPGCKSKKNASILNPIGKSNNEFFDISCGELNDIANRLIFVIAYFIIPLIGNLIGTNFKHK